MWGGGIILCVNKNKTKEVILAYSKVIITQSAVSGAAGVSREDIVLFTGANPVTLTNDPDGNVGVVSHVWTLLEAPQGSAAVLINWLTATCELQPDVAGKYVIRHSVNGMTTGTGVSTCVVGVRFEEFATGLGHWLIPAFKEGTFDNSLGNDRGAQRDIAEFMRGMYGICSIVWNASFSEFEFPSHLLTHYDQPAPAWNTCGYLRSAQHSTYINRAYFDVTLRRTAAAGTAKARLYDVTHAVAITGGEVTTTSNNPTDLSSAMLSIGSNAGDIRTDVSTKYRVDIEITGGVPGVDYVEIFAARLRVFRF